LEEWISLDMTFPCNGANLYKTLRCPNQEGHNLYVCSHKNLKLLYILYGLFFFFERDALMYLAFFIFHKWCCTALSHFTSFLSLAYCDDCPVMAVCTWTVGRGSLHYVLFSGCSNVIPQHPLLLPCISLCFSILRYNGLELRQRYNCVIFIWFLFFFSVDDKNWTCGRKFCGIISHLSVLLGTVPINNFINHPFLCAGCLHALYHDIIFLCIHFQIGRISSCIIPLNLCISWMLMVSFLFGFAWMLYMHDCFTVSETAERWRKQIICTYC
jgi:hypothetical protein